VEEPGKKVEVVVPASLQWLANYGTGEGVTQLRLTSYAPAPYYERDYERAIDVTDFRRLTQLFNTETEELTSRVVYPSWLDGDEAIPGLVVAFRYSRQDAHGIARGTRELDMAFRRAAALMESVVRGDEAVLPIPIRPERGGLWLLEANRGSYEAVYTFYGALVAIAASTPVSLAAFASLLWDIEAGIRSAIRWKAGRSDQSPKGALPGTAPSDSSHQNWGLRETEALQPVMLEAAKSGAGVDFAHDAATCQIRLIIYPRE
jgi:hypothetical protein